MALQVTVNNHEELPAGSEREIIEHYFYRGFRYDDIILFLEKYHNIDINVRSLKRRLNDYGLKRRESDFDEQSVKEIIRREIANGPDSLNGYRTMWNILRIRYHIHVPRRVVASLLREIDPSGVEDRKRRVFHRRKYVSPGPNFCWHIDGYDKLKPFGFSVHGGIDGFSRKILWLELQRSNKNPKVIAQYFLDYIEAAGGCPTRVYADRGTENGLVAGMQCYLRADGSDEYAGSNAHKYVPSTKNQRIECFWSSYRKQRSSWWIDLFHDMQESDILDLASEIHKEALWFSFADLLQSDLDKVKDYWNSHRIRKSKHATCSGIPDIMYFLPEEYGKSECLQEVCPQKLTEMKGRLNSDPLQDDDTVWEEYFTYVMDTNGLQPPATVQEAGILFQSLVSYAKPRV